MEGVVGDRSVPVRPAHAGAFSSESARAGASSSRNRLMRAGLVGCGEVGGVLGIRRVGVVAEGRAVSGVGGVDGVGGVEGFYGSKHTRSRSNRRV